MDVATGRVLESMLRWPPWERSCDLLSIRGADILFEGQKLPPLEDFPRTDVVKAPMARFYRCILS